MAITKDLHWYLKRVERLSGLEVSTTFPSSPTDEQQLTLDEINTTLRELNNHYYLTFKQVSYTLTTSSGTHTYNLAESPYSQTDWEVSRMAKTGVVRVSDDYPLMWIDHQDWQILQPNKTGSSVSTHYSGYGKNLLFYPAPSGETYTINYYGTHIGTDSAGTTKKWDLTATDDLPMIEDRWQDALVIGAAAKVRRNYKYDERAKELKRTWEEWRTSLIDMMQPGEDAYPRLAIPSMSESYIDRKIGPIFGAHLGG